MPSKAPEQIATDTPQAPETVAETKLPRAALAPDAADLPPAIEAVLLTLDRPASLNRLAETLGLEGPTAAAAVRDAIDALNVAYESTGRSFRVEQVAGGFRVMTLPRFSRFVAAAHESRASTRLSRAAVETLAVVAYRQPITRAEIEAIRGVACGEVLRTLLERRLAIIAGRAEVVGQPILYGTSRHFLEAFGLASIKDLPAVGDFAAMAHAAPEPGAGETGDAHP